MKWMKYHDSAACLGCVVPVFSPLSAALYLLFVDREGSSVDHYRESAHVSHASNAGFCPAKQFWEFLPRAVDKEGNI